MIEYVDQTKVYMCLGCAIIRRVCGTVRREVEVFKGGCSYPNSNFNLILFRQHHLSRHVNTLRADGFMKESQDDLKSYSILYLF